jgi:hypothetical protein
MYLKYPQWQEPLAAAILEFDAQVLPEKLQKAEDAIAKRFQELTVREGDGEEFRALTDGFTLLRDIRKRRSA